MRAGAHPDAGADAPQVVADGTVVESEHPAAGRLRQARHAARFSKTPAAIRHGGPAHGEHSAAILGEVGMTPEDLKAPDQQ